MRVGGQGNYTHTHIPAYMTQMRVAGQGKLHTHPCLHDPNAGRRSTHTHTHIRMRVAGQGKLHTHTHTHIPAYMTRMWVAGQGKLHTHTHIPAHPNADRRSGKLHTHTHPCLHDPNAGRRSGKTTHTSLPT